ncbi:MAG: S8 family serine peptidase [Saprospiraceae bacterium]|nr:S8 family serine peptidase [Saprospiraceae bacterium]
MRYFYAILSILITFSVHAQVQLQKIDRKLLQGNDVKKVCILLNDDVDLSSARNLKVKSDRGRYVYDNLFKNANSSQSEVSNFLKERKVNFRSYYIVNMISTELEPQTLKDLSLLESVKSIIPDGNFKIPETSRETTTSRLGTEWGLNKIKAPDVWTLGYDGQGVIIGGQDTGYEWDHDALKGKYRGWNGATANHDYNWHDAIHSTAGSNPCGANSPEPCDDHNHGTHTMGTMVGDDESGNQIGVSPGAKWIACRNMDKGNGTLSTYVECFEWFLAPYPVGGTPAQGDPSKAPHVINNSWSCPLSEGCDASNYSIMEQALENLRNSGVVIVVSNGNEGSGCESTFNPAAFFKNSFSIGSTTSSDVISSFSSRGPVTIDGSNRLKPNVVAPGSSVRSSIRNNNYATYSGTSMAGPHVAGTVALMISANPNLAGKVELIETILEETAVYINSTQTCGALTPTDVPNNVIGYGRIDALAAVQRALDELHVPLIKVDQYGYPVSGIKVAIISDPQTGYNSSESYAPPATLHVKDASTHISVFSGSPTSWSSGVTDALSGDKVWWFDFTSFTTPGTYYISDNLGERSEDFLIGNDIYDPVLDAAFKTFYQQRCGEAKMAAHIPSEFADGICHAQDVTCEFINDPGNATLFKDLSGGWHDAGDYNKYVNFAYAPVLDLLMAYEMNPEAWNDNMNIPDSGNGIPDLLDEVKVETDWLLKMQDTDGGIHCVVGVLNYVTASPPSADANDRYYGPKTTSASFSTSATLAFAARQFKKIKSTTAQAYATTLESAAINAYTWATSNPSVTYYNSAANLAAGEQELAAYDRDMRQLSAAIFLYGLTENSTYKTYVESNYTNAHLLAWNYAYPFEMHIQQSLLLYAHLPGVSTIVADDIIDTYKMSVETDSENIPSITASTDAYRAYIKSADIVWGSNSIKCQKGNIYQAYYHYNLNTSNDALARTAQDDFLHYIHGVNPTGLSYLTNMVQYGADNSVNTLYHGWYTDGSTMWDDVRSSTYGPPAGFLTGGPNPSWSLDDCCTSTCSGHSDCVTLNPPTGQPPLKSYLDWNASWPQNSWEITENSISYQAAYLLLLSSRVNLSQEIPVGTGAIRIDNADLEITTMGNGLILSSPDNTLFRLSVNNSGELFSSSIPGAGMESSILHDGSFYISENTRGLLIKSPDMAIWRIRINNSGQFFTETLGGLPSGLTSQGAGDLQVINSDQGIILKDEDGNCFMLEVDNAGTLFSKAISCPD